MALQQAPDTQREAAIGLGGLRLDGIAHISTRKDHPRRARSRKCTAWYCQRCYVRDRGQRGCHILLHSWHAPIRWCPLFAVMNSCHDILADPQATRIGARQFFHLVNLQLLPSLHPGSLLLMVPRPRRCGRMGWTVGEDAM